MDSVVDTLLVFDQLPLPEQRDFVRGHSGKLENLKVMTRNMNSKIHEAFYQTCLLEEQSVGQDLQFN